MPGKRRDVAGTFVAPPSDTFIPHFKMGSKPDQLRFLLQGYSKFSLYVLLYLIGE
jgi:hypothetical protein